MPGVDRATELSALTRYELDALPYGAIKLDRGTLLYEQREGAVWVLVDRK